MKHSIMILLLASASLVLGMEMSRPDKVVLRRILSLEIALAHQELHSLKKGEKFGCQDFCVNTRDSLLSSSNKAVEKAYDDIMLKAAQGLVNTFGDKVSNDFHGIQALPDYTQKLYQAFQYALPILHAAVKELEPE